MRHAAFAILSLTVLSSSPALAETSSSPAPTPLFPLFPPAVVQGLPPAAAVASAHSASCAIVQGEVFCWGRCDEGLCGPSGSVAQEKPVKVPGLSGVARISLYGSLGCAVHEDRTVSCWGKPRYAHVLGGRDGVAPARIAGLANVTKLSVGGSFACALLASGRVACWGKGDGGELGLGRAFKLGKLWEDGQPRIEFVGIDHLDQPRVIPGLLDSVDLACEEYRCCALSAAGAVTCWGEVSYYSQAHEQTHLWRDGAPHRIRLSGRATAISTSNNGESCAILHDGAVACWDYAGEQTYAQIRPQRCSQIKGARRFLAERSAVVENSTGGLVSCGLDGAGSTARVAEPPRGLPALDTVTGRAENGCGRSTTGEVFCWGYNDFAQLARPANPSSRSQDLIKKQK